MFNIGLLSDAALTGLSDADKESMQKQATQQFLLGSLLSGDPATGFKSASEIPATAISMQDMLRKSQLAQADQAALEGFRAKYTPTRFQEANPAYMGPVMPEQLAQQEQIKAARAQGLPFNIQNALQDILALPSASQSSMLGAVTALQPKMQPSGILLNPNMQAIGGIPTFDAKTGLVSRPVVQGGNVDFSVSAAPGYGKAVEQNITYTPQPGEKPLYDRAGNLVGVQNMNGSIQSLQERETAKAIAGTFGVSDQVVNPVTQQKEFRSRADILGYNKPPATTGGASGARGAGGAVLRRLGAVRRLGGRTAARAVSIGGGGGTAVHGTRMGCRGWPWAGMAVAGGSARGPAWASVRVRGARCLDGRGPQQPPAPVSAALFLFCQLCRLFFLLFLT